MTENNGTKSLLAASMKNLMCEKPFVKINISEICEGCGMNRKSFYYHFKDKYDLMNWIFYTDFIAVAGKGSYENGWDLLEGICELFYNDARFYRSAFKTEGQNSFREYLAESMAPMIIFLFEDVFDEENFTLISDMLCEVFVTVVSKWVEGGCKTTPEEFVAILKEFSKKIAANIPV